MILKDYFEGNTFDAYRYFGAHWTGNGFVFRTCAPGAEALAVKGDFSGWKEIPMERRDKRGIWSLTVPEACPGQRYQYVIRGKNGTQAHCDPFGFAMELRPGECSVIPEPQRYCFTDQRWMRRRSKCFDRPLNIYELHFGSWIKNGWQWHSYASAAEPLIRYLKDNGYTHVEMMPLGEHTWDESWGYLTTGFYAPTSRYGTADQLRELIDRLHHAGIGVILDFVLVHFDASAFALEKYSGESFYEIPGEAGGRSEWGSWNFDVSRGETASFLKSCANYWLKEFHFDGLRMDAVSRLIYHRGEESGGERPEGIRFLRELNQGIQQRHKSAMLIAEDSSAWPGVTAPLDQGGLGFDYKWNMGWMHDTLQYLRHSPQQRMELGSAFAFSICYAWNERYILSVSHDEQAPGRGGLLGCLPGTMEEKMAQGRLFHLYMITHPGKKLRFMGLELGTEREWDFRREQYWELLSQSQHRAYFQFIADLNRLYIRKPALWRQDGSGDGFLWMNCRCEDPRVFGYARKDAGAYILVLMNFGDRRVRIDPDWNGKVRVLLHTGWECYGGKRKKTGIHRMPEWLEPYSGVLLEFLC